MKTNLSVNINKIALLRNSRGSDIPNLLAFALDAERFGADGITVHPRPDERHIRYSDLPVLAGGIRTEFNVEGYPSHRFIDLVLEVRPAQVTLVPDPPGVLTSTEGWDTVTEAEFLKSTISRFKSAGIRVSLFMDPVDEFIKAAADCGADRIEFYTGDYAHSYSADRERAVAPFIRAAALASDCKLGINAGHDLNLENLAFFRQSIPQLMEVSIGHALVRDCLYYGLENTIGLYQRLLA